MDANNSATKVWPAKMKTQQLIEYEETHRRLQMITKKRKAPKKHSVGRRLFSQPDAIEKENKKDDDMTTTPMLPKKRLVSRRLFGQSDAIKEEIRTDDDQSKKPTRQSKAKAFLLIRNQNRKCL